jgi:hypothetical protein
MNIILADTGGLYSLLNRKDEHHAEAMTFYNDQMGLQRTPTMSR